MSIDEWVGGGRMLQVRVKTPLEIFRYALEKFEPPLVNCKGTRSLALLDRLGLGFAWGRVNVASGVGLLLAKIDPAAMPSLSTGLWPSWKTVELELATIPFSDS